MLFHISIAAERPKQAARLIAELWGGRAYPFPPVAEGSWIAMAGDERGSAIEVYPLGTELHQGEGESEVRPVAGLPSRNGPVHVAIATEFDFNEVKAIAKRFGAPAKLCSRGPFQVIELWVEGCFLIEVLTPQMQAEYLAAFNFDGWERFLAGPDLA
ncbi:MAG TPA: hypothetical protein VK403_05925, partial [Allosphingosinicella sp.]|nr:hypothetical protein [Allosphingosinicella sp.]